MFFKDHVATDLHKRAMALWAKKAASSLMEFAPIARAMGHISKAARLKIKRKKDIAYTIAKENLWSYL